jgi:16S rRNA (guanine527-N7)-methyltransferase
MNAPECMQAYATMLAEQADRLGLTALRDPAQIQRELIADSLTAEDLLEADWRVLDLGSGGGCPGLPLAIQRPDLQLTLVEANGRKSGFLREAVQQLGLTNVRVANERSEFLARQVPYRESFDAVVAKAVAPMPVLIELALPFLEVGGILVAFKGPSLEAELQLADNALSKLGGVHLRTRAYSVMDRSYVHCVIEKRRETPHEYPRRPGIPAHSPL